MKLKRILSLSLALMLVVSLMSFNFSALADGTTATPQVTNVTSSGTYTQVPWGIGTARYSDQSEVFSDFNGYTFGENAIYLQPTYNDWNNTNYQTLTSEWLKFDINRTADVYIITFTPYRFSGSTKYMRFIKEDGWGIVKTDGTVLPNTDIVDKIFDNLTDELIISTDYTGTTAGRKSACVYKKSFALPSDGQTTQTISLKGSGYNADGKMGVYGVVIDFKEPSLANVKYNGSDATVISPVKADSTIARWSDQTSYVFENFNGYTFGSDSYYIQPVYADAKVANATDYLDSTKEWISFDLNKTAHVYLVTNVVVTDDRLPWVDSYGFKAVATDGSLVSPRTQSGTVQLLIENFPMSAGWGANGYKKAMLYKKTYVVPEDETLHISLKGGGDTADIENYGTYGVIVDFTDDDAQIPEEMPVPNVFSSQVNGTQTIDDVEYSSYFLAFAKNALASYGSIPREDYGFIISKTKSTESELVIGAEDVIRIKADNENHPANADGQYGVLIYGAGYDCGDVYYLRPYSIYGGKVIYGSVIRNDDN